MDMPKISVIIAVYQAEATLENCVESVLSQDYNSLELILADNGSKDRSAQICDRYAGQYPNVRAVHTENTGPGDARNRGMELAEGSYIMFLDADDELDGRAVLSHMQEQMQQSGADILAGNFRSRLNGQIIGMKRHHLKGGAYVNTPEFRFNGFYRYGHLAYCWGKLYKKSFLEQKGIRFKNYRLAEDKLFNLECCAAGAAYAFTDRSIVIYTQRDESRAVKYVDGFSEMWVSLGKCYSEMKKSCCGFGAMDDIEAFHYVFGAFFLVKQELSPDRENGSVRRAAALLRQYAHDEAVERAVHDVARGRFCSWMGSSPWRVMIQGMSVLLTWNMYGVAVGSMKLIRFFGVDHHVWKKHHKKDRQVGCADE